MKKQITVNMINGFGKARFGDNEFTIIRDGQGLWSLGYKDYTRRFPVTTWVVEDKKRFSTVEKYINNLGIDVIME